MVLAGNAATAQYANVPTIAAPPPQEELLQSFSHFPPGNQIKVSSKLITGVIVVREVRGEWIFADIPGQNSRGYVRIARRLLELKQIELT